MNDIKEIMANKLREELEFALYIKPSKSDVLTMVSYQVQELNDCGFVIVPIEPNNAMISAGMFASESGYKFYEVYGKMIEASQCGDV